MNRHAIHHCGMDARGHRHWRMKPVAAMRRCVRHGTLLPRVVWVVPCGVGREVWRNGLQQRRWRVVVEQVRSDRRSFLTTLGHPALVSPVVEIVRAWRE